MDYSNVLTQAVGIVLTILLIIAIVKFPFLSGGRVEWEDIVILFALVVGGMVSIALVCACRESELEREG